MLLDPLYVAHSAFSGIILATSEAIAAIAQLGERQTEDLKVPGSIPGLGTICAHGPCHMAFVKSSLQNGSCSSSSHTICILDPLADIARKLGAQFIFATWGRFLHYLLNFF